MLLDGPFSVDGEAGAFFITDLDTFTAHEAALAAFKVETPAGGRVLAGNEAGTVTLRFADAAAARAALGEAFPDAPAPPRELPPEIAMERVLVVLDRHGLLGQVDPFIASLPADDRIKARHAYERAPKLIVASGFAQGFKAFTSTSDEAWTAMLWEAVDLVL